MGQKVGDLVEQVDAVFRVFDADMHMHPAYQQTVCEGLHILGEDVVSVLVRGRWRDQFAKGCVDAAMIFMPCSSATPATVFRSVRR